VWAAGAWNKQWYLVIELVERLPPFRIKSQHNLLPIVIDPGSSVNGEQVDVDVCVDLSLRNAMQFSKSEHGHQMPGQGTGGSLTWTPRGRRLYPGWCRARE
jgi:hypothetical protein